MDEPIRGSLLRLEHEEYVKRSREFHDQLNNCHLFKEDPGVEN
jgi:hypothetical protein